MKEKPYHHLSNGTFRNPKGSPVVISRSGKFSYITFSKLRKKISLKLANVYIFKEEKLNSDLEKYKIHYYIASIEHATYLI